MTRKKVFTIIFLIILIGGIVFLALLIKDRPTKEQKAFADKFAQDMQEAKTGSLSGTVSEITGEKLTLFSITKKRTELKINEATPVVFMNKEKKLTKGQITDVKAGDFIDLKYDRATTAVVLIIEFRS